MKQGTNGSSDKDDDEFDSFSEEDLKPRSNTDPNLKSTNLLSRLRRASLSLSPRRKHDQVPLSVKGLGLSPRRQPSPRSSTHQQQPLRKTITTPIDFHDYQEFKLELESPVTSPRHQKPPDVIEYTLQLKAFAAKQIRHLTMRDLFDKHYHGAKTILTQQLQELYNQVKSDILEAKSEKNKKAYFNYYAHCLRMSLNLCDFHTAFIFYLALNSPEISNLMAKQYSISLSDDILTTGNKKGFLTLPKSAKHKFCNALKIYSESNGHYEKIIAPISNPQTIPWLIPIFKKADKIGQMSEDTSAEILSKASAKSELMGFISKFTAIGSDFEERKLTRSRASSIVFSLTPRQSTREKEAHEDDNSEDSTTMKMGVLEKKLKALELSSAQTSEAEEDIEHTYLSGEDSEQSTSDQTPYLNEYSSDSSTGIILIDSEDSSSGIVLTNSLFAQSNHQSVACQSNEPNTSDTKSKKTKKIKVKVKRRVRKK